MSGLLPHSEVETHKKSTFKEVLLHPLLKAPLKPKLRPTDLQIHVTFASVMALPVFSAPSLGFSDNGIGYHSPHKLHYLNKTWFGSKEIVLSSVFNAILDEE